MNNAGDMAIGFLSLELSLLRRKTDGNQAHASAFYQSDEFRLSATPSRSIDMHLGVRWLY